MECTISVVGGDAYQQARSLLDWLRRDVDRSWTVEPVVLPPSAGEMGATSNALSLISNGDGVAVVLATVLVAWLRSRTSDVAIRLKGPNGTVEIDVRRTRDPDKLIESIKGALAETDR